MSVDKLLERIRKTKNPSVIDFSITPMSRVALYLQSKHMLKKL